MKLFRSPLEQEMTGFKSPLARKSAVALTVICSALGGLLSSARSAQAQQTAVQRAQQELDNCVGGASCRDAEGDMIAAKQHEAALSKIYNDAYKKGWDSVINAQKNSAPAQNNSIDQKYMVQAQALFAKDANGHYINAHVGEVVNNTIKLYNQAATNGLALRPGLYAPMRQYFNGLNIKDQDIALVAFMPSLDKALDGSFKPDNDAIKQEYAGYLQKINSSKQSSIVSRFRDDVLTRQPSGDPRGEAYRVAVASILGVTYPRQTTLALSLQANR